MNERRGFWRRLFGMKAQTMVHPSGGYRYWVNPRSTFNLEANTDLRASSVVVPVVNWIARNFPEPPLIVKAPNPNGDLEPNPAHPMVALMRRPNRYYSRVQMDMALVTDWILDGNAYEWKIRAASGRVIERWYIPSWMMQPKWDADGLEYITHYEYMPNGVPLRIDPGDVIHHRYGLDPQNIRKGLSPLKAVLREVFSDDEAASFTASLLRNMGVPGLLIAPKDAESALSPAEAQAVKAHVAQETTGDHRGEPLVFGAPTTVEQFGFSPEQMNLRDLRRLPEERITAAVGVAAIVVGLGAGLERSTFANFAEAREAATEQNLIPAWGSFAADYEMQLLPEFTDSDVEVCEYDLGKVRSLSEDENALTERITRQLERGVILRSEARTKLGYDAETSDEVFYIPMTILEVPKGSSQADTQVAPAVAARSDAVETKRVQPESQFIRGLERIRARVEGVMAAEVAEAFDELGARASRAYEAQKSLVRVGTKATDPEPGDEDVASLVIASIGIPEFLEATVQKAYERAYALTADLIYEQVATRLGVELVFNMADPIGRQIVATGGKRVGLLDVAGDAKRSIFRALAEGRANGDGPREIARRIRERVPEGRFVNAGSKYRAEMIARTETKYAQNISTIRAYQQSEVVTGLRAFDAQRGATDAECMDRNGRVFTFDEAAELSESEHPSGTLSFSPVV